MSLATLRQATVRFGDRTVIDTLDLAVAPGEFLAVLGPNGAGKSTLCKLLLGLVPLTSGSVTVDAEIGYIPQQAGFDRDLPIRGRDLVQLGLDGHRRGLPIAGRAARARVDAALEAVGALDYANAPIGRLSGGEQQRLRIAQALVTEPGLLLCDEPLLSLDLANQQAVSRLIDEQRTRTGAAVVFVTHEINPVASYVDRVLYLVNGRWAIGPASEVLTSACLSELYATAIDVLEVRGRIVVIGSDESDHHHDHG